jgi:methionine-rich copper-binding protein CopC
MGSENAPTPKGREAAEDLRESTRHEEERVEAQKGDDLKKGAARVDERSKSSDGHGVGEKQRD